LTVKDNMQFRFAKPEDADLLAPLNAQLIRDEGHRNQMTVPQLAERMSSWLRARGYDAVLFADTGMVKGYALFRQESDHVYLRTSDVRASRVSPPGHWA
jgi:hypothetical protein